MTAIKLVLEDGKSVTEVSKERSIHDNSLYLCISEYEEYGESALPGHGNALSPYEINNLRKKILNFVKSLNY
ncbi:transposase [Lacrimispora brassicae]